MSRMREMRAAGSVRGTLPSVGETVSRAIVLSVFGVLALVTVACHRAPGSSAEPRDLTVAELHALPETEPGREPRVRLRGVVTYTDPEWDLLYVQDATGGMNVSVHGNGRPARQGQMVEIDGIAGGPAVGLAEARVKVVGEAALPAPLDLGPDQLLASAQSQWVAVEGRVHVARMHDERFTMSLLADGERVDILVLDGTPSDSARFTDAVVRASGVCLESTDKTGASVPTILVSSRDAVHVVEAGRADPFTSPLRTAASLADPSAEEVSGSRVCVRGRVVVQRLGESVVVDDTTGPIEVYTTQRHMLVPGEEVDAAGFPAAHGTLSTLRDAVVRPVAADRDRSAAPRPPLAADAMTSIARIRTLDEQAAQLERPLRIRGVVTYCNLTTDILFVQDESAGIYVDINGIELDDLRAGQLVEIDGVTASGGFAPDVAAPVIRVLGEAPMPRPRAVTTDMLSAGALDSQWVEMEGIVHGVRESHGAATLDLWGTGGSVQVFVADVARTNADALVGARVRIRGVCGTSFNLKRQLLGYNLYVPSSDEIDVEQAAAADPFSEPQSGVGDLMRFAPQGVSNRRARVRGVVTLARADGSFFLADETGGLEVIPRRPERVGPGDLVEAVGFPVPGGFSPRLEEAEVRSLGSAPIPAPRAITAREALTGAADSDLVTITGTLVERVPDTTDLVLVVRDGPTIFKALLPGGSADDRLSSVENGSLVRLTGVCSAEVDEYHAVRSIRILVESPASVEVLAEPSLVSLTNAIRVAGALAVVALVALAWSVLLRRRVRAQTALIRASIENEAKLEKQYRDLFENATDVVYTTDLAGNFTSMNAAGERTLGLSREAVRRMNIADLAPPDGADAIRELLDPERSVDATLVEIEVVRLDGVRLTLEVQSRAIRAGATVVAFEGIARNVSERKQAEAALKYARDAAVESARVKSEFLANMSHEIRTPMNGIIGMTSLALDTTLDATQREYLTMAKSSADALLGVIDDILDFSKIEAGKLGVEAIDFALAECVTGAIATLELRARQKGLALVHRIAPDVPSRVVGDPGRLRQVLLNLVGNAVKFTERGEVSLTVDAESVGEGEAVLRFEVKDQGVGIPLEKQRLIFEAFAQADSSTTRQYGGTGLGLAISSQLVALMGGTIGVTSVPGDGSTFAFTVRLGVGASPVAPSPGRGERGLEDRSDRSRANRSLKVLVAEDNPVNQRLAVALLTKCGHSATLVGTGVDAVDTWQRREFDLILMDVQMPEMDGLEATRAIREREAGTGVRIPIVATTAHAMKGDRERCLAAGMDDYLSKPLDPEELLACIARQTDSPASGEAAESRGRAPVVCAFEGLPPWLADDPATLDELVETLAEQGPSDIRVVRAALDERDAPRLASIAHSIKGSVSMFGDSPAVGAAKRLERLAADGDLDAASGAVSDLDVEIGRLVEALRAHSVSLAARASR